MTKTSFENNQNKHEIINLHRIQKTQTFTLMALVGLTILVAGTFFQDARSIEADEMPKSKYIIENLKGYSLGTHAYWKIVPDETLYVNIKNDANLPAEKLEIIKDTILSLETFEIDESKFSDSPEGTISKYYSGWKGALSKIKFETKNQIPTKFDVKSVGNSAGDIIITLTNMRDGDGAAGITKTTVYGDEIVKSEITIYDASMLSDGVLEQVSRHEFGHALGLAHSNTPNDLMNPQPHSVIPYISKCNVNGIVGLYDGKTNDKIICVKGGDL